jgi:hypothetical protein
MHRTDAKKWISLGGIKEYSTMQHAESVPVFIWQVHTVLPYAPRPEGQQCTQYISAFMHTNSRMTSTMKLHKVVAIRAILRIHSHNTAPLDGVGY